MRKPPRVIAFRALQALGLFYASRSGYWRRAARRADIAQYAIADAVVLAPLPALLAMPEPLRERLHAQAEQIAHGQWAIFGAPMPDPLSADFSADWRYDHAWPKGDYRQHRFYTPKPVPYDVKFAWEFSRLQYLVPVALDQLVNGVDPARLAWVHAVLQRWRDENPLAETVNWYPMEASMRVVTLTVLAEVFEYLAQGGADVALTQHLLLCMLREHGDFVWRNREFTDMRGNHFTANLVALLLAGYHAGNPRWVHYARQWIPREALLQFLEDGGNFEKSFSYHKLVLELFLLASVALQRMGEPFDPAVQERLSSAAIFCGHITRPDGLSPIVGDTDDAYGLPFYLGHPRHHGQAIALAEQWFGLAPQRALPFIEDGFACWAMLGCAPHAAAAAAQATHHFAASGFVTVRDFSRGFYFVMDIGEVGMHGRGGHGHNDLLSFELWLGGHPIVMDPGCSTYTGDLEKKRAYRSTRAHNTLWVGEQEMAEITGHWSIANHAVPVDVSVLGGTERVAISAAHQGYSRLHEGLRVSRWVELVPTQDMVTIHDAVNQPQRFESLLHLAPGLSLMPHGEEYVIAVPGGKVVIHAQGSVQIGAAAHSDGYGLECSSQWLRFAPGFGPDAERKNILKIFFRPDALA